MTTRGDLLRQHVMADAHCGVCADGWPQPCPHGKLRHRHRDVEPPLEIIDCQECADDENRAEQRALTRWAFGVRFPWLKRFLR